jgi:hypothetical protein
MDGVPTLPVESIPAVAQASSAVIKSACNGGLQRLLVGRLQLVGVRVAPCWQVLEITEVPLAVRASSGRQGPERAETGLLGTPVATLRLGRTRRVSRLAHKVTSPRGRCPDHVEL